MQRSFFALALALVGCFNSSGSGEDPPPVSFDAAVDGGADIAVVDTEPEPDAAPGDGCARGPENTSARCSDGCDNDGDGLIDDAEASCATCEEIRAVDLLFVVDDSGSMREEQVSLSKEAFGIIRSLVGGSLDGRTIDPIADLRVGVVTTDMGIGGVDNLCPNADFGDDAILQTGDGCEEGPVPFLTLQDGERGADDLARALECRIEVGNMGCGFEQPLEAMLKALTPSTSDLRFSGGTNGHGDGANSGFLRDDALLMVVMLTDEDDCSAIDPAIFRRDNSVAAPELNDPRLNLRCSEYLYGDESLGVLHPIQRFVEGLLELKGPERLLFAPIVGIPTDLAREPGEEIAWDRYVGDESVRDPRLVERPQPDEPGADPSLLTPSCDQTAVGRGVAMPPTRILRTARALQEAGAQVSLTSICQEDYSSVVRLLFEGVANLPEVCR